MSSAVHAEVCDCPVQATARIVSGKWTLVLLRDLAEGPRRFSQLERSLTGISPRTLTQRLRALEAEGVIVRTGPPNRCAYDLTDRGRHLVPIIEAMREYGERWLAGAGTVTPAGAS